ncbi:hypothetical protein CAOG_00321 [Capsaspora owczarzaki ATCC 30864]|uniref:RING-CH-type domain-containing protein n=1 Tax=Capsaspora owczarzaki (strain ATCC 30864) TaxID=595528 RepID=A0A0D2U0G9_CAPO3|nr:hypothetical protein CAOG_00321 [Capsaspora owczarzaki ATCC 30864]KJE88726.1 hypothetical protein CAOG_000321 [Capsaspora owczarzaki ATCC 30864]|eukprot:XP_004365192.1 hypothetical protein CAOG_00321 [Capsaspora owczarzaki ATCC 30864]
MPRHQPLRAPASLPLFAFSSAAATSLPTTAGGVEQRGGEQLDPFTSHVSVAANQLRTPISGSPHPQPSSPMPSFLDCQQQRQQQHPQCEMQPLTGRSAVETGAVAVGAMGAQKWPAETADCQTRRHVVVAPPTCTSNNQRTADPSRVLYLPPWSDDVAIDMSGSMAPAVSGKRGNAPDAWEGDLLLGSAANLKALHVNATNAAAANEKNAAIAGASAMAAATLRDRLNEGAAPPTTTKKRVQIQITSFNNPAAATAANSDDRAPVGGLLKSSWSLPSLTNIAMSLIPSGYQQLAARRDGESVALLLDDGAAESRAPQMLQVAPQPLFHVSDDEDDGDDVTQGRPLAFSTIEPFIASELAIATTAAAAAAAASANNQLLQRQISQNAAGRLEGPIHFSRQFSTTSQSQGDCVVIEVEVQSHSVPKPLAAPASTSSIASSNALTCRYCKMTEEEAEEKLITPCACKGSMGAVHRACLHAWVLSPYSKGRRDSCEVCKTVYSADVVATWQNDERLHDLERREADLDLERARRRSRLCTRIVVASSQSVLCSDTVMRVIVVAAVLLVVIAAIASALIIVSAF